MENKYLESLACKIISGRATEEEKHLLHLWYDAEWMDGVAFVGVDSDDKVYLMGQRLFSKIRRAGGGK